MLTSAEHQAVTAAVAAAEAQTDGEIVTVVTARSDAYHDVALHYGILAILLVTAAAAVWPQLLHLGTTGWGEQANGGELFRLLVAQAVAFLLVRMALAWRPLRLTLTPRATKARRVRRRAVASFRLATERRTVAREGVLIFLSMDEHMAEIVADRAVHAAVPPECWGEAMAALVDEVRAGRAGAGLAAAAGAVGRILSEGLPKTEHDLNELPDRLIEI